MIEETFTQVADAVSLGLEALALVVIVVGAVEAAIGIFTMMVFRRRATGTEKRTVWLEFSHWLVAGLTFQLAADIVQTMVVPGWEDLGKVAAIAVIRTFLTYFLDRDIDTMRERNARRAEHAAER